MVASLTPPEVWTEILLRIGFAFLLGMLFGLERQYNKKPVGFGPFTFVITGSAAVTTMAVLLSDQPLPILGAVITGIGFLGAGAILKSGEKKVTGLTTAASLWIFATLGIIIGVGMYLEAIFVYLLIGLIVVLDHFFEKNGFGAYSKSVTLTVNELSKIREIEKSLPKHKTFSYSFDNSKKEYTVTFLLSGSKKEVNATLNSLVREPNVTAVKVE